MRRSKVGPIILLILVVELGVSMWAVVPANSIQTNEVKIIDFRLNNNIAVNGTAAISFELQSASPISNVLLNFTTPTGNGASVSMSLVEGNNTYGWWRATITPRVISETVLQRTTHHLEPMTLRVTTASSTVVLSVGPSLLPTWSTQAFSSLLPLWGALRLIRSFGFVIAIGLAVAVAVLVLRSGRHKR